MKTAKEWGHEFTARMCAGNPTGIEPLIITIFREAQMDAFLAGLKFTALNRQFFERCSQLDKDADEQVGESIVPFEDIVEIAFREFLRKNKIKEFVK